LAKIGNDLKNDKIQKPTGSTEKSRTGVVEPVMTGWVENLKLHPFLTFSQPKTTSFWTRT